jgi:hypothetical protein
MTTSPAPSDPRAAVEYRVPAASLKVGDIVNTSPGEDDWQEVTAVFLHDSPAVDAAAHKLVSSLEGRYVVIELTDIAPVDSGVYFDASGEAMIYGADEGSDTPVKDVVSGEDGVRTYLYTRYELVSIRAS